jgi:hypothetical protein
LLEDTVLSARSQIIARLAWNSDPSGLRFVLELAVTAPLRNQEPAFLLQKSENLGYLHAASIHGIARLTEDNSSRARQGFFCEA